MNSCTKKALATYHIDDRLKVIFYRNLVFLLLFIDIVEAIKVTLIYRLGGGEGAAGGGMSAVFVQWKKGLTERPILALKCLKTMTTSTSLTTDDM